MTIFQNPNLVLDHEYHAIEVDDIPTSVLVWLVDTFGPAGKRWFHHNNKIYFYDKRDYMWFELAT
jgi:hypothetical protein